MTLPAIRKIVAEESSVIKLSRCRRVRVRKSCFMKQRSLQEKNSSKSWIRVIALLPSKTVPEKVDGAARESCIMNAGAAEL